MTRRLPKFAPAGQGCLLEVLQVVAKSQVVGSGQVSEDKHGPT